MVFSLRDRHCTVSTAESCTGGGLGHVLTEIPGSSAVYPGGLISYSSAVKHTLLGVPDHVLQTCGAVSPQTVQAMAEGARKLFCTDYAVGITGLAGPDGDGSANEVGTVYIGIASRSACRTYGCRFYGDRGEIRQQAVCRALELLMEMLESDIPQK